MAGFHNYVLNICFFIIILCSLTYAQVDTLARTDTLDTVELKNDKVYKGKVTKVKTTVIEFKEAVTNLSYEFEKSEVKYVRLSDGTTLTFNEQAQLVGGGKSENAHSTPSQPEKPPAQAQKEDNASLSKLIIISAAAVVGVLLLVAIVF